MMKMIDIRENQQNDDSDRDPKRGEADSIGWCARPNESGGALMIMAKPAIVATIAPTMHENRNRYLVVQRRASVLADILRFMAFDEIDDERSEDVTEGQSRHRDERAEMRGDRPVPFLSGDLNLHGGLFGETRKWPAP